jgi:hypothetical protein
VLQLSVHHLLVTGKDKANKQAHLFSMGNKSAYDMTHTAAPAVSPTAPPVVKLSMSVELSQPFTNPPKAISVMCNLAKFVVTPNDAGENG